MKPDPKEPEPQLPPKDPDPGWPEPRPPFPGPIIPEPGPDVLDPQPAGVSKVHWESRGDSPCIVHFFIPLWA